jgi:hypothetical protein
MAPWSRADGALPSNRGHHVKNRMTRAEKKPLLVKCSNHRKPTRRERLVWPSKSLGTAYSGICPQCDNGKTTLVTSDSKCVRHATAP